MKKRNIDDRELEQVAGAGSVMRTPKERSGAPSLIRKDSAGDEGGSGGNPGLENDDDSGGGNSGVGQG